MIGDQVWRDAKQALPFGSQVEATVLRHLPFGFFVEITDFPEVAAVVDGISYFRAGEVADLADWPAVGDVIQGVVVDHVEHNRQVKLRVG
ncbi:RNA-binding protein [Streptomyces noursei]|uniref:RNA-binding protein n=1 Tax=Streptomyces noursei TaxID=1971 RepID=UPI000A54CE76|nr:RNA-binding protein [Streptomyces noursei]